jgi:hypothetical protein
MPTQATPSHLIEELHRGEPQARALLTGRCRGPIARLVDRPSARHHLGREREILIERALHDVLEPVLPDAVFVEATLARFTPVGRATFSGAGFCRVTLRRSGDERFDIHRIGGPYLGLGSAKRAHLDWAIRVDDEVMMASDGLFEQPDSDSSRCPLEASLARRAAAHLAAGRTLHDAILAVLEGALRGCRQRDDIAVLTIRYLREASAGREAEHVSV